MTQPIDIQAAKEREVAGWTATAAGWNRHHAFFERYTAPVSEQLIRKAGIRAGMRVLDIACGTGHPALAIAERVGPAGFVLGTDLVEPVVAFARERARDAGLGNVEFRRVDGEALDVPLASFDAVTLRWGIMFMPRPVEAMRGAHAALRPGGRIALAAFAAPEKNAWAAVAMSVIGARLRLPPPPPGVPGIFAFADRERLRGVMEAGGFHDVDIEPLDFVAGEFASGEEYWAFMRDISAPVNALYRQLPPADRPAVDAEIRGAAERYRAGDRIVVRGTTWIAAGRK
jgi:SAM-dependent methyltransferase